ncbi:unnamed protein product [Trichobilharzia regenti]|nr:unnamed protein product [Trichobilharzia regenti]
MVHHQSLALFISPLLSVLFWHVAICGDSLSAKFQVVKSVSRISLTQSLINKVLQKSTFPSLGASGGICAIIGAFSMLQPNARLCIPFVVDIIPHSFQASNAIWVMLCIETLGILFFTRRSALDHAAHAGGLLFGMYCIRHSDTRNELWLLNVK